MRDERLERRQAGQRHTENGDAPAPFAIGFAADRVGLGAALGVNALFFSLAGVLVWLLPETRGVELE